MDATTHYEFIGFGAMDATKPYDFIWFGAKGGWGAMWNILRVVFRVRGFAGTPATRS